MEIYVVFMLLTVALCGPAQVKQVSPEEDIGLNMKSILVPTSDGKYRVEDLVNSEIEIRASASDVTYHFYSHHDVIQGSKIRSTNIRALEHTEFKGSKETLFIVHGWVSNNESDLNYHIRKAILSKHDVNVFIVDWSPIARRNYITAQRSVVAVGNFIAAFISSLVDAYRLKVSRVSFVGHSLGAHISGNAGAALSGQVDHIVGLDPALPLFSFNNIHNRVDPTDAKYVQIIHTNGGLLGFKDSIGHSDYFPNGGSSQPGCGLDLGGVCSHSRAYYYYTESVESIRNLLVSTRCRTYREYSRGSCRSNAKTFLGGYPVDIRAVGDYFLDTHRRSPFGRG